MFRRWLTAVAGVSLLMVGVLSACTERDSPDESLARPTITTTSTLAMDPTSVACESFATLWVEFAQIYSGPHGFGDTTPDPHGVRAREAGDAAFAAAAEGSPEARRLGAKAEGQFDGTIPGDAWATIAEFFRLCGQSHPVVECDDNTACGFSKLDRP
jgi:hypothetical protein